MVVAVWSMVIDFGGGVAKKKKQNQKNNKKGFVIVEHRNL